MLLREWGRSGSPGAVRLISFEQFEEPQKAEVREIERRLNHCYTQRTASSVPSLS
jgi:hypothetical protein